MRRKRTSGVADGCVMNDNKRSGCERRHERRRTMRTKRGQKQRKGPEKRLHAESPTLVETTCKLPTLVEPK